MPRPLRAPVSQYQEIYGASDTRRKRDVTDSGEPADTQQFHMKLRTERKRFKNVRVHFTKLPEAPRHRSGRSLSPVSKLGKEMISPLPSGGAPYVLDNLWVRRLRSDQSHKKQLVRDSHGVRSVRPISAPMKSCKPKLAKPDAPVFNAANIFNAWNSVSKPDDSDDLHAGNDFEETPNYIRAGYKSVQDSSDPAGSLVVGDPWDQILSDDIGIADSAPDP